MVIKIYTGWLVTAMMLIAAFSVQAEDTLKPDAEAVWNFITKTVPYQEWGFWQDHQDPHENTNGTFAPMHKIFVNKTGLKATGPPLPYGTMIVKENLSPANEVVEITVKYKVKDYNPDAGDWFWAKYSTTGEILTAGKPKECIDCHIRSADNDYINDHLFK